MAARKTSGGCRYSTGENTDLTDMSSKGAYCFHSQQPLAIQE